MKKITLYLFTMLVAVFAFHSCEDPYAGQESALPTIFEQGAVQTADGFVFALGEEVMTPIAYTEEELATDKDYQLLLTKATPDLPEGTIITFKLEASDTPDFAKVVSLPSESADNAASVKLSDLDAAVKSLYGRAPYERDVYVRATYYLVKENSKLQGATQVVLGPIKITPVAPVIEEEYYLIGGMNGWALGSLDGFKFNHSGGNVYDNPIFTITVNLTEDETWWKVVPKSYNVPDAWSGVLGNTTEDGYTGLEGSLVANGGAMKITEKGWVKITLNMMEYTYKVELIGETLYPENLYINGGDFGGSTWDWSNPGIVTMNPVHSHPHAFWAIVYVSAGGEFKFSPVKDWAGDFGKSGDATDGVYAKGGDNVKVTDAGYYMVYVDLKANKISVTAPEVYLIGATAGNKWDYGMEAAKFTVDNAAKKVISPAFTQDGELRMYATCPLSQLDDPKADWWQMEFIVLDGKIAYRGIGDDQTRVSVSAGQKVSLDFQAGTGEIN